MMPKKMVDYVASTVKIVSKSDEAKFEKETIHSGQFMVSHFEAEDAMDDLDDSEVKMLDPEDPSLMKPGESNVCMQLQLYVPRNTTQIQKAIKSIAGVVTSHLEIETSLTKLFKCMNLAYSQKLTSPKWNHFKGVRLRWKDKIRLNNVIWRCWHMQFILKRKTPVCQFASPLDADVHSNPQSVVLEGKYWKRQLTVIKAEYRKWRRNYISKTAGSLSYDNKSDFDFLEWSPLNEKNFFPSDEWTSDILFSSINVPFPFPDPREIARGAGIADFIQPSLGPLQPNLDDIDLTFADLLQNSRLPSVPEEASDEMLKNVEYGFPAIMGPDQMDDSSNILEVHSNSINQNNDDANMIELNNSLNTEQFNDAAQQFETRGINYLNESTVPSEIGANDTVMIDQRIETQQSMSTSTKHFGAMNDTFYNRNVHEFPGKSVIKGRISKNFQRPFRRELHNYDKAQPTPHQTTVYHQMLAEQQKQDNSQLLSLNTNIKQHKQSPHQTTVYQQILAEQQKQDNSQLLSLNTNIQQHKPSLFQDSLNMQYTTPQNTSQDPKIITNNRQTSSDISESGELGNASCLYLPSNNSSNYLKKFDLPEYLTNITTHKIPTSHPMMSSKKLEPLPSEKHVKSSYEFYGNKINSSESPGSTSYKATQLKTKCSVVDSYLRLRSSDEIKEHSQRQSQIEISSQPFPMSLNSLYPTSLSPNLQISSQQKLHQKKKADAQKEMFRSNSLPLNVSLNRMNHDSFVAPKYHIKSNKSRSRSNSIHQHITSNNLGNFIQTPKQIQPATSDPLLQSSLAQLLTTPKNPIAKQSSCSDNTSSKFSLSLIGSEFKTAKESITTLKAPAIGEMISNSAISQESSQPKPHQPIIKAQVERDFSVPMSAKTVILYNPRENNALNASVSCEKSHSISSESLSNHKMLMLPDQSQMISTENQRRAGHIHAEQKRRYNIKNGFDMLHSLIPHLQQNSSSKLSKAAMLQKGAEHIKFLRTESGVLVETIKKLQKERDALNNSLSHLHTILPANGAPLSRQGSEHVMQLYEHYVRYHTLSNWKFWILGLIMEPLLATFTSSVSSTSLEEMRRTAYLWIDQHCSLIDLRPAVSNKLKYLSMNTDILSNPPSTLHEEVKKAISLPSTQHLNLHG